MPFRARRLSKPGMVDVRCDLLKQNSEELINLTERGEGMV